MKKYSFLLFLILTLFSLQISAQDETKSEKTALLLIDIQDFYFPGGPLPLFEPEKAAENAQLILNQFRNNNETIIHVKHKVQQGGDIHELVKPIQDEKIITKTKANSFVGTDLLEYLKKKEITQIVLCGMQTHMCLEAATRAASDYGFNCIVIEDACATRDLTYNNTVVKADDVHNSTLNTLNGTYAKVLTVDEYLSKKK